MVEPVSEEGIRGLLHRPERASGDGLVLTHGAGSDCHAPLLAAVAEALEAAAMTVLRCDLAFRQSRPHGPPRGSSDADRESLARAVGFLRARGLARVFLGGHSYGGRQASMLAAAELKTADALLLLSYPLHPPNKPSEKRTSHFERLRTPALFAHGSRDPFGAIEDLRTALALIPSRTELLEIEGAGHDLAAGGRVKTAGRIAETFLEFLAVDDRDPVEIPITDVFDLHSVGSRDAKGAVEAYLEEARRLGLKALRIIHGRGIGARREMVRAVLERTPFVEAFADAPAEAGGWGATVVTLR